MSTKVLLCPWCRTSNLAAKLASRGDRCRQCGNRVTWGLSYLREQAKKRKAAKTKAERARLRKEERNRPEWKAVQRQKRIGRAYRRAELLKGQAWQRVVLTANEHDYDGLVAATRALVRAERALQQALRALKRTPGTESDVETRRVILPTMEGDGGGDA